jgi:hypothetical protein
VVVGQRKSSVNNLTKITFYLENASPEVKLAIPESTFGQLNPDFISSNLLPVRGDCFV